LLPSTPISKLLASDAGAGHTCIRFLLALEVGMPTGVRRIPKTLQLEGLPLIHPYAGAMDISADEIVVAVPPDRDLAPVRSYRTFTPDLQALVEWLVACRIDTVALESTGVYWIPIYELLEQHGIVPYLVNARHVKMVPGRKTDWNDAQWLQKLHALGLLQSSFQPDAEIAALRTLVRYRAELIQHRAPHILHMQRALQQMNIQLERVLTDIMGVTGQAIIRAIVAGERDPVVLAQHRNPGCRSSTETIAKALTGTWKEELLFVLRQALAIYDAYTVQIAACDTRIEEYLKTMESRGEPNAPLPDLPRAKPDSKSKNAPAFNARAQYARIIGVDLVAVMGLSASSVQTIISEIGTDMSRWPTVKHFCAWLGLAPRNDISGGKVLRSRTRKVVHRAAQAFRQAAQAVIRSDSAIGAYYRSMRARKGPMQATVATAHKIARIVYHLLKYGEAYQEEAAAEYEQKRQERELRQLMRRANKLGYTLTQAEAGTPISPS
jgi:transposase